MTNSKTLTTITGVVVLPVILITAWAVLAGQITVQAYVDYWQESVLLLLGFWFRGLTEAVRGPVAGNV